VHLEAVLVQPRLEVRVPQEVFLGPDVLHDVSKVGVVSRHAQVLVLLVVRPELWPHVLLQVRHAFVVDEAVLVQPRLDARCVCEARTESGWIEVVGFEAIGFGRSGLRGYTCVSLGEAKQESTLLSLLLLSFLNFREETRTKTG
jgi:hypothetical protein